MAESGNYELIDQLVEEFAGRYRKGERPALNEYLDRYPDLADELRHLLPAMVEIEQVKEDVDDWAAVRRPNQPPLSHLGDYHILREIGHGGMGVVYEAEQLSLGRRVALKLLRQQRLRNEPQKQRFEREAKAAARLHHTNIVPVFGVGEHDRQPYYVMQLIRGLGMDEVLNELRHLQAGNGTELAPAVGRSSTPRMEPSANNLARTLLSGEFRRPIPVGEVTEVDGRLANARAEGQTPSPVASVRPASTSASGPVSVTGPLSSSSVRLPGQGGVGAKSNAGKSTYWQSVARIGVQVASALEYAHKQGVLHRDVKPSNLLLDNFGTVWVTDFGLAKMDDQLNLTQTGDILGTLRYISPEAFEGKSDPRSDVYSLGLTLYELLTLRPAFDEPDQNKLIKQVTTGEPAPLSPLNSAIPGDLVTIVHKATAREPAHRYATAEEMQADLQCFLNDEPIRARPVRSGERLWRWCRRNPSVALLATSVLVLISTLAVVSTIGTIWLSKALSDSNINLQASATNLRASVKANAEGNAKLWESLIAQARASRMTRQPGQRLDALRAIKKAQELPLPPGRTVDELRTEAIAALLLPDVEIAKEWAGAPVGTTSLSFAHNFERYARGAADGKVSLREVMDDKEICTLPGGRAAVAGYGGVRFSPDGRFLCQGFWPSRFDSRLWKLNGRQPVKVRDDGQLVCAFEPGGHRYAATYPERTVRVFDLDACREIRRFSHGLPEESALTWNPRHAMVAAWSYYADVCQLLDVNTGKVLRELRLPDPIRWVDWHPEGEILAACTDRKIYLIDSRTAQQVLPPLEGHKAPGIACRFSHTGDWLVSTDWAGLVRIWDTRTGQQLLTYERGAPVLEFSRDDTLLGPLVSGTKVGLLRCYPSNGLRTLAGGSASRFANETVCFDPERRWLASTAARGVSIVDVVRGRELAVLPLPQNDPLRFDSDDHSLWTSGTDGLLRWPIRPDPADPNVARVGPPERLASIARRAIWGASPDGALVSIPNFSHGALLMHRPSGRVSPLGPQDEVRSTAVSPDKRWVATGTFTLRQGNGAKVWDAASGRHVADLPVPGLCTVRFSPDGKWLVTIFLGGGCRIWEVGTWREGAELGASNGSCAFSADGRLLALGDRMSVVRLVVPKTGREIARLTVSDSTPLHPGYFTPDGGQLIAVGSETGSRYLFDLRAIRHELQGLNLDWDALPLPPAAPVLSQPGGLVVVDMGDFREKAAADRLVAEADELIRTKEPADAIAALRLAIQADPSDAVAHNELAWQLLMGPMDLRDSKTALSLARRAVELSPHASLYSNTLGLALYRNGEFQEGIGLLEKSLVAGKGESDAFDLFILAMCDQRLSKKTAAKDCFSRAVKWFQERRGTLSLKRVDALLSLQAETEKELGRP